MSEEQKQLIREKWLRYYPDCNTEGRCIDCRDKEDIENFWLNELDLVIKETEERIVKQVEQEFSMFTLQDWSGEQEIYDQLDTLKDDIFDLIRNK